MNVTGQFILLLFHSFLIVYLGIAYLLITFYKLDSELISINFKTDFKTSNLRYSRK